jgi:hypothetical protein
MRYRPLPDVPMQVGDALPFTVFDRTGKALLVKGHVIDSDLMLVRLQERGMVEDGVGGPRPEPGRPDEPRPRIEVERPTVRLRDAQASRRWPCSSATPTSRTPTRPWACCSSRPPTTGCRAG